MASPILKVFFEKAKMAPQVSVIFDWDPKKKKFISFSWNSYLSAIQSLVDQLKQRGMREGDIALIHLNNSFEFEILEKACFEIGASVLAVETHLPQKALQPILHCVPPNYIFSESNSPWAGLAEESFKNLKAICIKNVSGQSRFRNQWIWKDLFYDRGYELSQMSLSEEYESWGEKIAYRVFTSGSTGLPKQMTYSQTQILQASLALLRHEDGFKQKQRLLSWLPMANLFQRTANFCALLNESKVYIFHPPQEVMKAIRIVRPTTLIGVPRFFEKIHQKFSKFEQRLGFLPEILRQFIIRKAFYFFLPKNASLISGSAALKRPTLEFFENLGCPILEAYGLTECILPVAMNTSRSHRSGSVGLPLRQNQLFFSSENEIYLKSEFTSSGALDSMELLHTGDIGFLDRDGFLHLKDRQSRIIKLSTGRKVFRTTIENNFIFDENIDHFLIFGNEMPYLVALITLQKGFTPTDEWRRQLRDYMQTFNSRLNSFEQIRDYILVARPLAMEAEELTANLKVKYEIVEKNFSEQLGKAWKINTL